IKSSRHQQACPIQESFMSLPKINQSIKYRGWYISRGESDDDGRLPLKDVFFEYEERNESSDPRRGWADSTEEAKAEIDGREAAGLGSNPIWA
ncbi:MAG: hypothetical protein ACRYGG_00205, partial [Janthinobacterium lividum]